jgi:hypothetical protein
MSEHEHELEHELEHGIPQQKQTQASKQMRSLLQ